MLKLKWFFSILLIYIFFIPGNLSGQVQLNEVVSSSELSFIINGESPDWIELYNAGSEMVDLTGYFLSDDSQKPDKWIFPSRTIAPGEFLLVLADDLDMQDDYLHTNFKIASSGEDLLFSDSSGNLISTLEVPALETDISYGKIDQDWHFLVPTPGSPNVFSVIEELSSPVYNLPTGLYLSDQIINISHPDSDVLFEYYLNDLKGKAVSSSNNFSLALDSTTVICTRSIKEGAISSKYVCNTYLIDSEHDIPVLSVIADNEKLFDPIDGLFELGPDAESFWPFWGANFWSDRDEEVYFQYFNVDGTPTFKARADLEMHGGRESRTNAQKTFRLMAKAKYDQAFFNHPFFPSKEGVDSFKRIVIRNASGDFNAGHCRDGFLQDYLIKNKMNLDATAYQPVAVYINGKYYGMMAVREKMDKYYSLSNYGTTDVDLIEEQREVKEGDINDFNEDYNYILSHDLSNPYYFEQASEAFDLINLTDYFLSQICHNSTAWPQNNIKYWKARNTDSKWRYLLFDMDIALGRWPWTVAEENSLQSKLTSYQDTNVFINTLSAFLDNEEFKNYLLNRHQDLYNTDFSADSLLTAFDLFTDTINTEVNQHLERWPSLTFDQWESIETEKIRTFIKDRPSLSTAYFDQFFSLGETYEMAVSANEPSSGVIHLNSLQNINDGFEGEYFRSVPISITAIPIEGKYFMHWEIFQNGVTTYSLSNTLKRTFSSDVSLRAIYKDQRSSEFIESIYFNPQKNDLSIKLNADSDQDLDYSFYDFSGRLISNASLEVKSGENFINIPTRFLSTGNYIVHLVMGDEDYSFDFFSLR